jgi:pimeloyl-ACP methyl ester carboxylesterase
MTIVLVHGVPNTAEVWGPLRSALSDRDAIALKLPGFGCEAPAGFSGTRYAYRDWLIEELTAINEPVDLVGHDQGSVISQGVILARPDLINSWVLGAGVCADDFFWHRQARIWQNTGLGERWRDHFLALDTDTRAGMLVDAGVPAVNATNVAAGMDRRMFDYLLPLYRSESYLEDWAFDPAATYPPGLVLWGKHDPYQSAEFGRLAAAASGARFHELACGHWWQVERPHEVAAELIAHWSKTGSAAARPFADVVDQTP